MNEMSRGIIVGIFVAVVLAGFTVAVLDYWPKLTVPSRDHSARVTVAHLGPGGKSSTAFGDGLKNAAIPGSQRYDFCFGEMHVQRPSMMTTDMPDAFCTVTRRGGKGPWRITTGGWQECRAVCVRLGKK
jgi:hypothetical protein